MIQAGGGIAALIASLFLWAAGLAVLYFVIRGAVLSALRQHELEKLDREPR
jgi:hypothetical protein